MIVDFHTHIFPDKIAGKTIEILAKNCDGVAYTDGTVNGLLKQMEDGNCDIAVSLPVLTKPTQFDSVMNYAISVNENFKNSKRKIISFAGIHPACDDIAGKMKMVKDNGFLGVKIHPDYQNTYIDDEGYIKILSAAKDLDLIVVTHAGVDEGYKDQPVKCPPELALKVIKKIGHSKFVLGHYGGHQQWKDVLSLLCGKDVYFDTAFTLHEIDEKLFKDILNAHDENKILFATDCPWRSIKEDVDTIKSYNLDKNILDKILYKNALKLLNIGE